MADLAYVATAKIERQKEPLRYAHLAGESSPVILRFKERSPIKAIRS